VRSVRTVRSEGPQTTHVTVKYDRKHARPMTHTRAPRVVLALLAAEILVLALAGAVVAQDNETRPAGDAIDYAVVVFPVESPSFGFAPKEMSFPAGSRVQLTYDHGTAEAPHNLDIYEGLPQPVATKCCLTGEGGREAVRFTMPASGVLKFKCDVHPDMQGVVKVDAFSVGGAPASGGAPEGHTGVPALGVHFLAYWVGVIAFAVLFVVYGLTFFLFKYGENATTTDHMDRPGAAVGGPGENRGRAWFLIGITIAVVVGGALIAAANLPKGE